MARKAKATVPRCWYTLVRNRPTPGTPIAKSASLCSANSFTWRGVMICSASDFNSSGLRGLLSSATSSPFTRIVAGRPTLSSRSEAFRWTICVMAPLKLKVAWPDWASGMGVHSEKGLAELDRLCVFHEHLANHAGDLGLDFVHDLHGLDDADDLPAGDAAPGLHIGFGPGLRRRIKRPHHGRLDFDQMGRRRRRAATGGGSRGWGRRAGRLRDHDVVAPPSSPPSPSPSPSPTGVRDDAGLGHPHGRPGPEQTPAYLDGAQLRRVLQDLHELRDDVEVHAVLSYTSSMRSVSPSESSSAPPPSGRCTSSSMRTPPSPARYTPGSIVTTAPAGNGSALVFESRGASCTSSPSPCPSE